MMLIHFLDTSPDSLGRRCFVLFWIGRDQGRYGTLAGQHFHADPKLYCAVPLELQPGEDDTSAACRVLGVERTQTRGVV